MIDDGTGLRGLAVQWRHNAQGCGRKDAQAAGAWRSCARELEAALSAVAPPPVLEGWVLVPREPTQAMVRGFWGEIQHGEMEEAAAKAAYAAMLAASPAAPAQAEMQAAPVAWQAIESAPKDGRSVIWGAPGWVPQQGHWANGPVFSSDWDPDGGYVTPRYQPTHWQALPPPPTGE